MFLRIRKVAMSCLSIASMLTAVATPSVIWTREISSTEQWMDLHASGLGPRGEMHLLIGMSAPPGSQAALTNAIGYAVVESDGRVGPIIRVPPPQAVLGDGSVPVISFARDISVEPSGQMTAVIEFVSELPWIVRGQSGRGPFEMRAASGVGGPFAVSRQLLAGEDVLLLLGHRNFDALVARSRMGENSMVEQVIDWQAMDFFVDGVLAPDGTVLLLGGSGTFDLLGQGPSITLLVPYVVQRLEQPVRRWVGRPDSMLSLPVDRLVIAYQREESGANAVRVRVVNARKFDDVADTLICHTGMAGPGFQLHPAKGGGVLVVGSRDDRLHLTKLTADGQTRWNFSGTDNHQAIKFQVLGEGDGHFNVLFSTYTRAEGGAFRRVVRVIRFSED